MSTQTLHPDRERTRSTPCYRPEVDILERPDELLLRADVPGARVDAIDVRFENGTLTLRAPVEARQGPDTRWLLREYGTGDWQRRFELSESIDPAGIRAEYADGVLTLHLPKVEAARPRRIPVTSG